MSVVTKGPRNIFVIERNSVPVKDVCDAVAEHKTLNWLQQRFGVRIDEVFECLDTYVDISEKDNKNVLSLAIYRDEQQKLVGIDTVAINDRVYFAVLCYGSMFFNDITCFNELFTRSLKVIAVECLMDIRDGVSYDHTDRNFVHSIVLTALEQSTGIKFEKHNVEEMLRDLDHEAILESIKQ